MMTVWRRLGFFAAGLAIAWLGLRYAMKPESGVLASAPRDPAAPTATETSAPVADNLSTGQLRHAFDTESGAPQLWALMGWLEREGSLAFDHAVASMEPQRVLQLWAVVDPDAAVAFVRTAPDRTWQRNVARTIARAFPNRREALAAAFPRMRGMLSSFEADSPDRRFLRDPDGFTLETIRQDPRGTARALVERLDGPGLARAVNEFVWRKQSARKENALPDVFLLELLVGGRDPLALSMSKIAHPDFDRQFHGAAERVASEDPDAMKHCLKQLHPSLIHPELIRAFLRGWARSEGPAAFKWAETHIPNYVAEAFATWAGQDPQTAARFAIGIEEPAQKLRAATHVAETWSASHPEAALSWILQQSEEMRPELLNAAFANLVAHDPSWAAQWAAEALLDANESAFSRAPVNLEILLGKWAETSPSEAAAWVQDFEGLDSVHQGLGGLARKWFQQDETAVIDWVNTLPDGPARTDALSGLVEGMVEDRPEREFDTAFQWITRMEPGEKQASALLRVLLPWLPQDAPAVAEALETSTFQDEAVAESLRAAVRSWAFEDVDAVGTWIDGLDQEAFKDPAIHGLIDALTDTPTHWSSRANVDPVLAREWANHLSNPDQRAERMNQLAEQFSDGKD